MCEHAVAKAVQPVIICANPDVSLTVRDNSVHLVACQPIARRVGSQGSFSEPVQSAAIDSYPETSIPSFRDRHHASGQQSVRGAIGGEYSVLQPREAAGYGSDPQCAFVVGKEFSDDFVLQLFGVVAIVDCESNAIESGESFFSRHP